MNNKVTDAELQAAIAILRKLQPGFLPFELFLQVARLVALPIFELVPLRRTGGSVEVLLLQRPADDPFWSNMLHIPGTVIRATDNSFEDAYARIVQDELAGTDVSEPHFVEDSSRKSRRGTEFAQIHWAEVVGEPKVGKFYPVDALPGSIVEGQAAFIQRAVESFGN